MAALSQPDFAALGKGAWAQMSWAALPWATARRRNPALLSNSSLCAWRQKETKGRKRKVEGYQKRNLTLLAEIFSVLTEKKKKISSGEYLCSVLISFRTTPGGWAMSRRKIPVQYSPISIPAPLAFFPMPLSFPACQFIISSLDLHTENHPSHFTIIPGKTTSVKQFWPLCLHCPTFFHLGLLLTA